MHIFIAIVVSLIVGAGLGYGLRGKINKGIHAVGANASKVASDVAKKV